MFVKYKYKINCDLKEKPVRQKKKIIKNVRCTYCAIFRPVIILMHNRVRDATLIVL